MPAGGTRYLAFAVTCLAFLGEHANAQSCRNYLQAARADIGKHVAAMQRYEHEVSDRLKGLDSRPFDFLLGEARKTAAIIADPSLQPRDGAQDCRDPAHPVRRLCADAAQAWIDVLQKYQSTPKPDYDRPRFAATVEDCEKLMNLKPLKSPIRGTE
jgi:hypothetical protein